jgi:uncharacterized protein YqeY
MKDAMKSKDKVKLEVVRFLRSAVKNWEIDNGPADDAAVQKIVATQVKQTKESIDEYNKGGRQDLVNAEKEKLAILETYLPEQLSEEELIKIVDEVLAQNPDSKPGPLVGQVMAKVKGQADGGTVAKLVNQRANK